MLLNVAVHTSPVQYGAVISYAHPAVAPRFSVTPCHHFSAAPRSRSPTTHPLSPAAAQIVDLSSLGMSYYNNLLSLPFFFTLMLVYEFPMALTDLGKLDGMGVFLLLISSVLGMLLSVSAFLLNKTITATSQMVVNNVNKFCLIFISAYLYSDMTVNTGTASAIVMASAAAYSYQRMNRKKPVSAAAAAAAAAASKESPSDAEGGVGGGGGASDSAMLELGRASSRDELLGGGVPSAQSEMDAEEENRILREKMAAMELEDENRRLRERIAEMEKGGRS